jgi:flagellar biogenesis protein FliO
MSANSRGLIKLIFYCVALITVLTIGFSIITWAQDGQSPADSDPLMQKIQGRMTGTESSEGAVETKTPEENAPSLGGLFFRLVVALGITLGALYGALVLMKRFMGGRNLVSSAHVKVLGRSYLSAKSSICLVEVAGRVLVIGESSAGGMSLLTEIKDRQALSESVQTNLEQAMTSPGPGAAFESDYQQSRAQQGGLNLSDQLRQGRQAIEALREKMAASGRTEDHK